MPEITTAQVLVDEAAAIHGVDIGKPTKTESELYSALGELNSAALCLSGGGGRSAAFSLGVIEALATHPRPVRGYGQPDQAAAREQDALLAQFHYLSTVSAGGHMGGWLSAWIMRAGYPTVWRTLISGRDNLNQESGEIAWLRAYSNYLSSKSGAFETWTAVALYIRNLFFNWLVILPAFALSLLGVKAFIVASFWAVVAVIEIGRYGVTVFAVIGAILTVYAMRFSLLKRPSGFLSRLVTAQPEAYRDGVARVSAGADATQLIRRYLLPVLAAALLLSVYLVIRGPTLANWSLAPLVSATAIVGVLIYAVAWVAAWPPAGRSMNWGRKKPSAYWLRDFFSWALAGGVYGASIGLGVYVLAQFDLWILLGNIKVPSQTGYLLIALIYGVPWIITAQFIAEMIFVGLTTWQPNSSVDREWFGSSSGRLIAIVLIWPTVMVAVILFLGAETIVSFKLGESLNKISYGLGAAIAGVALAYFGKSLGAGVGSAPSDQVRSVLDWLVSWVNWSLPVTTWIFFILLAMTVSTVLDYLLFGESFIYRLLLLERPSSELSENMTWLAIGIGMIAFIAAVAWMRVNINTFSLHAIHRDRLVRAYLAAANPARLPNSITGIDQSDDVLVAQLWPRGTGQWHPFHVVNVTLNAINSKRLGWQERGVESFTVTPLHCGTAGLGYRLTSEYGDVDRGGISLGTALAISGTTASPNAGYHASPVVSSLLSLFSMRLGWWLGNPGPHGDPDYYRSDGPTIAILPFIKEMFGFATDDQPYVYLSDGRHFESLGLYEMIRRRCRCIVVSDAGSDSDYTFADLGNAVRKIGVDLGVDIRFDGLRALKKRSKDNTVIKAPYYAIGTIDYGTASQRSVDAQSTTTGYILYIKPGYHGTESVDIIAHAATNVTFPHEGTGDRGFSESQFEAYRKLGFEIVDGILSEAAEKIAKSDRGSLSRSRLCDLVEVLALPSLAAPDVAEVIKTLGPVTVTELRTALNPPASPGSEKPA